MKICITEEKLREATEEAVRVIFHGTLGLGQDQYVDPRGFRAEMVRIIVREIFAEGDKVE